jgi:hypothetical protein
LTADPAAAVQSHAVHSRQYHENAIALLQQDEAAKAGELIWGSLAQAFHALAAANNQEIKPHRDLKNFAIQLSREMLDESIAINFDLAENLHFNFYVVQREVGDIMLVLPLVEELRQKIFNLIPPELLEQRPGG